MEPENDMLVPIRKRRPDIICDSMSNALTMVIMKDHSGQRMWWRASFEDGTNLPMYTVNTSTAQEGS
jgi:hypothetical protein